MTTTTLDFDKLLKMTSAEIAEKDKESIRSLIAKLNSGELRVATPTDPNVPDNKTVSTDGALGEGSTWTVHEDLKKAILLYFKIQQMEVLEGGKYLDKIPTKIWKKEDGVRVVPPATVRFGAFVAPNAVLMPCYINIGAYVGEGTMIDTWATVGSCAQVGKHVHVSGGVGIGGVLEPVQAAPVVIEDNVFLGSRCIVVEGVRVGKGAVIGAGVTLTASTHVVDVTDPAGERVYKGYVPENSVVIPGVRQKTFASGTYGVPMALIIGKRNSKTDAKTSLTEVLREHPIC